MMLGEMGLMLMVLMRVMMMVVLVVVSTVGTVRNGRFIRTSIGVGMGRGVALLLRWGSVVACRWIHGGVCL